MLMLLILFMFREDDKGQSIDVHVNVVDVLVVDRWCWDD